MPRDKTSRSLPAQADEYNRGTSSAHKADGIAKKQKSNFALSGALAAESKTTKEGVVLKYHEPSEASKPKQKWRLYVYKGSKEVDMYRISNQSAYLFGRDRLVVDIPLNHESCSKQHAVLQFRETRKTNDYGDVKTQIKPYLIDLESTNRSYVNDKEVPESRYYELRSGDTLSFGDSERDYVLLQEDA